MFSTNARSALCLLNTGADEKHMQKVLSGHEEEFLNESSGNLCRNVCIRFTTSWFKVHLSQNSVSK